MDEIMISIPLRKYLKEISKDWGKTFVTKSFGGQVWISDEAPGDPYQDEGKNYIEFNESGIFMRLPKDTWKHFDIKKGESQELDKAIQQLIR